MKRYKADAFGDRQKKLKRNGEAIVLDYFSPYVFEKQDNAHICGYTTLKPPKQKNKKEPDGILMCGSTEVAYVYRDRPMFSSNKGYIKISGADEFVAITTRRFYLLAFLFLLLILLALLLPYCNKDTGSAQNTEPWSPTIEANLGEDDTSSTRPAGSQIEIAGFSSWHIPAGKTENLPITLKNPDGNPCYFSFSIILSDGETIYQSDMVPPGEAIKQITINRALSTGEYAATIHIDTNALEDGRAMNKADLNLTITVL